LFGLGIVPDCGPGSGGPASLAIFGKSIHIQLQSNFWPDLADSAKLQCVQTIYRLKVMKVVLACHLLRDMMV